MKHPFLNRNTETYLQEKHWCNVMLMIAALHSTEPVPRPGITLGSLNKSGSIIKTINYSRVFLALTNQKCLLWKRSIRGASQPLFSTNGLQPPCRWSLLIHLLIIMTLVCGFIGSRYMPQCVMSIPACSPNIISLCMRVCVCALAMHTSRDIILSAELVSFRRLLARADLSQPGWDELITAKPNAAQWSFYSHYIVFLIVGSWTENRIQISFPDPTLNPLFLFKKLHFNKNLWSV